MMLKILQITEATSAGVGRHVADLAAGLVSRNCEVHLLYSPLRMDVAFSATLRQLKTMRCQAVPMRRSPHPADLSVLRRIRRYVRDNGPFDIIHAHSTKAGILARLVGGTGDAKLAYTPHCIYTMNPVIGRPAFHLARVIERALSRRTDVVIAVSPEEESHLRRLEFDRERVRYIPNGIYPQNWPERSNLRRKLDVAEETVLIGFLGRFSPQKNPLLMVRAFAQLADRHPQVMLALAGEGSLGDEAKALAARLGVGERVRWLGYCRPGEFLPALDIFALTSVYEGLPYVLLEALCAGLPIVSTEVGGVSLAVKQGHNGIVVPGQDAGSLAEALAILAVDKDLRQRMGDASRCKAQQFGTDRMVDETLGLYVSLSRASVQARPVAV